jgi:hypothetical protein
MQSLNHAAAAERSNAPKERGGDGRRLRGVQAQSKHLREGRQEACARQRCHRVLWLWLLWGTLEHCRESSPHSLPHTLRLAAPHGHGPTGEQPQMLLSHNRVVPPATPKPQDSGSRLQ